MVFETVTAYWENHLFPKILSRLESTCQVAAPSMAGLSLLKPMPHHAVSLVPPGFDKSWESKQPPESHLFRDIKRQGIINPHVALFFWIPMNIDSCIFVIPLSPGTVFYVILFFETSPQLWLEPCPRAWVSQIKTQTGLVRNVIHTTGNQNMTDKMNI